MQGFYIFVDAPTTITFSNAHRSVSATAMQTPFKKNDNSDIKYPLLCLNAANINTQDMADETVIYFTPETTEKFNIKFDAIKLMNTSPELPNIYTVLNNRNYAIKALSDFKDGLTIPLSFKVKESGKYLLKVKSLIKFEINTAIYLIDTKENNTYNLTSESQINLSVNTDDNDNRFYIKFGNENNGVNNISENNEIFYTWSMNKELNIFYYNSNKLNGMLDIYNIVGERAIKEQEIVNGNYHYCLATGTYIVKLISENQVITKKVIIE